MELTAVYSFADAMKKLMLTDEEHNEVIDLFERESARKAEEDAKITRCQARQLEMVMSGGLTSREAFSASLEDLYTDLDDPPMFIASKTDIAHAQRFLRSVKLRELADCLWRYEGVASPPIVRDVSVPKSNEPSNATECTLLKDQQQALQTLENGEIGLENGEKRNGKALLRKVEKLLSGAKPVKRRRVDPGPASLKLPSGLRNSISGDNLEETGAVGPPALQAASSPHRRPAPPPPRRSVKEKKPAATRVRFVKKSPAKHTTPQTPTRQVYNPLEHTPDSATARRQTQSWLTDEVEPYTPLPPSKKTPSPLSTSSRTPKLRRTPSQTRLAQIENILGNKTHAGAKPVIPDRGYAVSIAPPKEAPLEILPEKTTSASGHADPELTPVSIHVENEGRDATGSAHDLGSEANKQPTPTTHAKVESVAKAPRPKKRKIQGEIDTAYRASGQRKPKTETQDKSSYKASGQKRQKIEVR